MFEQYTVCLYSEGVPAGDRQAVMAGVEAVGQRFRVELLEWIAENGYQDQFPFIGEPMVTPVLFVDCTPEMAQRMVQCFPSVVGVMKNQRLQRAGR